MEEVYIEQLDQLYWKGYGEEFKENNPNAYYKQLTEFINSHKTTNHEIPKPLFNGTIGCTIRSSKHIRHSKRSGNDGDLFAIDTPK